MCKDENREVAVLDETAEKTESTIHGRAFLLTLPVALGLMAPAFATSGEGGSSTGLSAVMSSMDNVVTLCTKVWNLLTGNEYLTLFLALSLVFAGLRVFRRAKRTASR